MKLWLTAQEIADEALPDLPRSKRKVNAYADRRGWRGWSAKARRRTGPDGGGGWEYHIDQLPMAARLDYLRRHLAVDVKPLAREAAAAPGAETLSGTAAAARDARLVAVRKADAFGAGSGLSQIDADATFATLYNAGSIPIDDWIRAALGSVSGRSIARWRAAIRRGDFAGLAVDRGASRKGTGVLDRAEGGGVRALALGALAKNPWLTAKHIRTLVRDRFGDQLTIEAGRRAALPPIRTFQHALKQWRHEDRHALARLTDPDGFRNAIRFVATGSTRASALNEYWQIDASPADVMTKDGRQSIYVAVDIWSRRMAVLVTATPRATAVGLLIRKCLVAWGVPERIKSDNGSDFTARWTRRLLASLGIEHELSAPFAPEQKGVVERAIGTFQRDCARTLPGFIGHSVADRKKIEAKTAFSRRLGAGEETLFGVDLTAAELQDYADSWAETIYAHAPHAGLKGATPFERAAAWAGPVRRIDNPAALDVLLAPVPGRDGLRRVTRSGIRIDGTHYLIGSVMPGEDVLCRMDPADLGRLYVFSPDGETFLGHAVAPELAGLDPAATIARVRAEQNAFLAGRVEPIRRQARQIGPRNVADAMRREAAERAGKLVAFPQPEATHTTSAIAAANDAVSPPLVAGLSGRAAELHAELSAETAGGEALAAPPANVTRLQRKETRQQRFARALALIERVEGGEEIGNEEALWLGGYRAGPEFRAMSAVFEDFGEEALR